MKRKSASDFDQKLLALFDRYVHGLISRREFLDGASKFVRGDAIAGVIITMINIVGGLAIGIFQYGMSFSEAGRVFTTLTIGDGLATQLPALIISLSLIHI